MKFLMKEFRCYNHAKARVENLAGPWRDQLAQVTVNYLELFSQ